MKKFIKMVIKMDNPMFVIVDKDDNVHIADKISFETGPTITRVFISYVCGKSFYGDFASMVKAMGTYSAIVDKLNMGPTTEYKWCRICGKELTKIFNK